MHVSTWSWLRGHANGEERQMSARMARNIGAKDAYAARLLLRTGRKEFGEGGWKA